MNENSILAETAVGDYVISTYDDGALYQTDVTRETIPPTDMVWTMGRFFTEEEAHAAHARVVSEIIRGIVPGVEA